MIDNIDLLIPFLKFESEDDFYFLQILQRKKENETLTSNSHVVKNYYIKSVDQLNYLYPEIIKLCKLFNARASLRLNKRSFEKIAYQNLLAVTNTIMNKDFQFIKRTYDRVCGQFHNDSEKKWILDIDRKDNNVLVRVQTAVKFCDPNQGQSKVFAIIPSKAGYHVITSPFNIDQFNKLRIDIEIHKDNPTNLFIP